MWFNEKGAQQRMRALVMAGGEGRRLRPLTTGMPKSLLLIGNQPILELALVQLRRYGIHDVTLAVAYLAPMIRKVFGAGENLGMRISYLYEDAPLGTAGALGQLGDFEDSITMMNGDILTDLDFSRMLATHQAQGAVLTVASKMMCTDLTLGVLDVHESGLVTGYREKPRLEHRFSLGIYIVEPAVKAFIRRGERIDMPDLITRLIEAGESVACYDHSGKWIDIGLPEDYARVAQEACQQAEVSPRDIGAPVPHSIHQLQN
jgi:NDP-sugar pyrophosphorylase family protein